MNNPELEKEFDERFEMAPYTGRYTAAKYDIIYADPPWNEAGGGKIKRGADRHYPLMRTKEIIALPVMDLAADNAHLYLWVTNNFLPDGLEVMKAWGFEYKHHRKLELFARRPAYGWDVWGNEVDADVSLAA